MLQHSALVIRRPVFLRLHKVSLVMAFVALLAGTTAAQNYPRPHELSLASQPPGVVAFHTLLANPHWVATIQPVRLNVPENSDVGIWNGSAFNSSMHPNPVTGLSVGPVARFQIGFVHREKTVQVYPSVELIGRLHPPAGLELKFPIEVTITLDDLVQASEGRMVTRVYYIENPESALPFRQQAGEHFFVDVSEGEDPLTVASRLGRAVAIVRMGSRIPSSDEMDHSFMFGGAPLQEFPQEFFEGPSSGPEVGRRSATGRNVKLAGFQDAAGISSKPLNEESAMEQGFVLRDEVNVLSPATMPSPMTMPDGASIPCPPAGYCTDPRDGSFRFSQGVPRDEYLFDGDDRNLEVMVDQNWRLYGLDTEDTIGHFDTLDGRRLVVPSNRVGIYSPRFASIRQIRDWNSRSGSAKLAMFRERDQMQTAEAREFSSTTMQQLMPGANRGTNRATGVEDMTRGVAADQVIVMKGARNTFSPYENLQLMRTGDFATTETTRLELGMQSAGVWSTDTSLQVISDRDQPIVVLDVAKPQELVNVKLDDGTALLRVCKIASKIAAHPGEFVDFTIRFDNVGQQEIGNVTIVDSLTPRLEYVDGSTECSLRGEFVSELNEGESLILRWEITDPLKPGEGGVIRFRCRVR